MNWAARHGGCVGKSYVEYQGWCGTLEDRARSEYCRKAADLLGTAFMLGELLFQPSGAL